MAQVGDFVRIHTKKDQIEEGQLMPSSTEGILIIKLSTGYNLGFRKEEIRQMEILRQDDFSPSSGKPLEENPELPTIAVLHTGGTIASKVDYRTGGVVARFSPEDLLSSFPELGSIANIKTELVAQMWSDDLRFGHFELLAVKIKEWAEKGVKGIIIGMGTDNMAVASAALSFIIEKINIPVIFLGAQRSSDRGSSDAAINLLSAAKFISHSDFAGVGICMHAEAKGEDCFILPANQTYKLHSSRRDAFQAINGSPIARISSPGFKISFLRDDYLRRSKEKHVIIKPKMEEKVGLLKIHINMFPEQFSFFKGYKGLIIEGTGLGATPGHVPNDLCVIHEKIFPAIKEVIDSGCVVVMTTQCLFGSVNCNVYSKGRDLQELGVISGEDMLANTALVKLSWLLGNYSSKEAKKLVAKNLRGEISNRRLYEDSILSS